MALDSLIAAKFLCKSSEWTISHLQLQKMLYIIHMVFLGDEGRKLVNDNFEAWNLGPVLPNVYHRFKIFSSDNIYNAYSIADISEDIKDKKEQKKLEEGVVALKKASAAQLVNVTHWENGAWAKNYKDGERGIVIPNEDIAEEYQERYVKKTTP